MVWARKDDRFPEHPKVWVLSDGAYRLHDSGICKSCGLLTDGEVDDSRIAGLIPNYRQRFLHELEEAGLWHQPGHDCDRCAQPRAGHHMIHDFLLYNPSKAKVEQDRIEAAERQKKWRESRRDKTRDGQRESRPPRPDPARPEGSRAGVSGEPSANEPPAPAADGGAGFEDRFHDEEQVQLNVERARAAHQALKAKAS